MAGSPISDLGTLSTLAAGDLLVVVDVSDTSMAGSGTTKKLVTSAITTAGPVGVVEDFTRANESPVLAGSVGGDPYLLAGDWDIVSNQLKPNNSGEARLIWYTGTTDYVFTSTWDVVPVDGGPIWDASQNAGADHYWHLGAYGGTWEVYSRIGGSFSGVLFSTGIAAANGDVVEITVHGGHFVIKINGVTGVDENTSALPSAPFVGFRANNDGTPRISSMSVVPTPVSLVVGSGGLYTIDSPIAFADAFGPDIGYDCEFDRSGNLTTPPSGWVFQDDAIPGPTYLEQLGVGAVSMVDGSNDPAYVVCLVQPVSAAGSYVAIGKSWTDYTGGLGSASKGRSMGLCVTDGTKVAGIFWNTNPLILCARWDDMDGSYNSNPGQATVTDDEQKHIKYWKIEKNSSSDYDMSYSYDGVTWNEVITAWDVGAFMTPTHFGFLCNTSDGPQQFNADWFRVR